MAGSTPERPSSKPKSGRCRGSFVNQRGVRLQTMTWYPKADRAGAVLFLHGYGACCCNHSIWQRVAEEHTAKGLLCMGFDYEGHGWSGGKMLSDLERLVDDAAQALEEVQRLRPGARIFVRGQSLGGLVAVALAMRMPGKIAGLILGAPAMELNFFVRMCAPESIAQGCADIGKRISDLTTPFAVFQGMEDWMVAPGGARNLFQNASSRDKTLFLYKDMGHAVSFEPDALSWILPRLGKTADSVALFVRSPLPGASWPPPPASRTAAVNTALLVVNDKDDMQRTLDRFLGKTGNPWMLGNAIEDLMHLLK